MRIWDLPVQKLCRNHLLGEHRELHAIWTYLTTNKGGSYRKHPETLRWANKLGLLSERHTEQVNEMRRRGWKHHSPLNATKEDFGQHKQDKYINTIEEQITNIKSKNCLCQL